MKRLAFAASFTLAAAGLLATACAPPPPGRVYVRVRPPVAVVETVGVAPGPDYIWIRGYHAWNGSAYVWVPGHYERRPHARAVWVEGHWAHDRHGWYWVEGHWRR